MSIQTDIFRQCIRKLRNWTGILAGVDFAVFELISHRMGGSAINGKIVDRRYYLGEHGTFTEVTKATFAYLTWHEISLLPFSR
ncbi:MAG TPA: hypothetical protein VH722_04680 [Alphaproteobacteria bacterium]|jgi:hypothetical protein|nr:hypothetical protein [Alphaproteobacteria bacterium]